MKRLLPKLRSLEMFEAAARHGSFTRAAEELGVTQSALSRQIAQLEFQLGIVLFERIRKRVVLSPAGVRYSSKVREALKQIRSVTMDTLAAGTDGEILHVATLATFGALWLAPRLVTFAAAHPEIAISVSTYHHQTLTDVDNDADIIIQFGEPSWPRGIVEFLVRETIVVVASPAFLKRTPLHTPSDLHTASLIQQTTRPDAWSEWLMAAGVSHINALRGPRLEQYSMIIEATLSGLGAAAIPRFLVEDHIAAGRLVVPFDVSAPARYAYHTVIPEAKRNLARIKKFREWLLLEVVSSFSVHERGLPPKNGSTFSMSSKGG